MDVTQTHQLTVSKAIYRARQPAKGGQVKNIFNVAYRQPAKNITADEAGLSEPPISPKKIRQEGLFWKIITKARERRIRIRKISTELDGSSDQHSNSVDLANPLPRAVDKLSDPSVEHTLPFPFVGYDVPNRFRVDEQAERNWRYVGRTKFKELVERLKAVRKSGNTSAIWLYGTQGYGKSHLLAALVCYLAAQDERIVYIPDCRNWLLDPLKYVQAAMLFAWADDIDVQNEITTMKTLDEVEAFLQDRDVIFVIDQMNALKTSNNHIEGSKRSDLTSWLGRFTTCQKSVYSSSANDTNFHEASIKQNMNFVLTVYGGVSEGKHLKNFFANRIFNRLDGKRKLGGEIQNLIWRVKTV